MLERENVPVTEISGSVRRAAPQDLDQVLELDRTAPVGHERAELLTSRVHSGEVIVFEKEDRLLGFAVVKAHSFFGRDFLELMTVVGRHRRQGIGTVLLHEAVTQSSTDRIFSSTNRSNTQMLNLLEKVGWHLSGQLEGFDEGDPEFVFYKDAR